MCLVLGDGEKYEGFMQNGMRNGKGKLEYKDGGYYSGEWRDNRMWGYGKFHYESGKLAY